MSSIQIEKISITDLETDAIVNAANEGLWAGGGVCGAIFRAAGHQQLQDARATVTGSMMSRNSCMVPIGDPWNLP